MKNTERIEAVLLDVAKNETGARQKTAREALEELKFIRETAKQAVKRGEPEGGKYADIWAGLETLAQGDE